MCAIQSRYSENVIFCVYYEKHIVGFGFSNRLESLLYTTQSAGNSHLALKKMWADKQLIVSMQSIEILINRLQVINLGIAFN